MSGKWPGFLGELIADYPEHRDRTDPEFAEVIGYKGDRQIRHWRKGKRPPAPAIRRIRERLDRWREKHRASDPGKVAEIDTELAGKPTHPDQLRDTSLVVAGRSSTPLRTPQTNEEAKAMGGVEKSIVWALLGRVSDDDTAALRDIQEFIETRGWERNWRGLHRRSGKTRGSPGKRR